MVALVAAPFDFLESLGSEGDIIAGVEAECSYVVKTDQGPPWVALGSYLDGTSDPVEFVEDWAQGVSDLAKLLA